MTRTVSVSFLVMDLAGRTSIILGVLVASLCSYGIANVFTMSAFNTGLTVKNMPYLPFMFNSRQYRKTAGEFAEEIEHIFLEDISMLEVFNSYLVKQVLMMDDFTPIVDNLEEKKLVGSVRTFFILDYFKKLMITVDEDLGKLIEKLKTQEKKEEQDDEDRLDVKNQLNLIIK